MKIEDLLTKLADANYSHAEDPFRPDLVVVNEDYKKWNRFSNEASNVTEIAIFADHVFDLD